MSGRARETTDVGGAAAGADERRLARRLERERTARREAEAIAEEATRRLYDLVQELERTNRELTRVNSDLEAFVYTTSHDLKSPIVTVMGYLNVLNIELADVLSDDQAEYLARVRAQSAYMRDLVRDLLELSRVGRTPGEVDTPTITDAIVRELADDRARRHDGLTVHVDPLPPLLITPTRCRQLFANLLDNAAAHAGRPGVTVRVTAQTAVDGSATFTVSDDGKGIAADDVERIFAPFHRSGRGVGADEVDDAARLGTTGLGLTICRKIVASYDGEMWAEASTEGGILHFRLPAGVVAG